MNEQKKKVVLQAGHKIHAHKIKQEGEKGKKQKKKEEKNE